MTEYDELDGCSKLVLGWREWVSLPELGIKRIKAKVDTGARTSALHAFEVNSTTREGVEYACFSVHPRQRREDRVIQCCAPIVDLRNVRDSGGHEEPRFVIRTDVLLGNDCISVELTLTSRDTMGFRMLLGRTALTNRYLVDVDRSYVRGKKLQREKRK